MYDLGGNEIPDPRCEGGAVIFYTDAETSFIIPSKEIAYLKGKFNSVIVVLKSGEEFESPHRSSVWLSECPGLWE